MQIILREFYAEKVLGVNLDGLFGLAEMGTAENMLGLGPVERRMREYMLYSVHEKTGIPMDRFFDMPPWFTNMVLTELRHNEERIRSELKKAEEESKEGKGKRK